MFRPSSRLLDSCRARWRLTSSIEPRTKELKPIQSSATWRGAGEGPLAFVVGDGPLGEPPGKAAVDDRLPFHRARPLAGELGERSGRRRVLAPQADPLGRRGPGRAPF